LADVIIDVQRSSQENHFNVMNQSEFKQETVKTWSWSPIDRNLLDYNLIFQDIDKFRQVKYSVSKESKELYLEDRQLKYN
jgi:hypothetical protein